MWKWHSWQPSTGKPTVDLQWFPSGKFTLWLCRWLDEAEDDGKIIRDLKIQGEFSTDQVEKSRVSLILFLTLHISVI